MDGYPELHRHLDGSLREATLRELAAALGVRVPAAPRFRPNMGFEAAIACFAVTLAVMQTPEAVRRIAAEACEDAEAEGVSRLELRFAPYLHRGAAPEAIIDAALVGIAGRAGLILCGLYGDPPAQVEALVRMAASRPGVVGLDLAGGPSSGHQWRLSDYAPAFGAARDLGLGRTVHAGEGQPVDQIRAAIEHLHAQRIGHGTTLLDDPAVIDLAVERGVVFEVCPTSNMQTGVIPSVAEHPLGAWLRRGVRATICTDNTFFSAVDAPTEWARAATITGVTAADLARCRQTGHAAAFAARETPCGSGS